MVRFIVLGLLFFIATTGFAMKCYQCGPNTRGILQGLGIPNLDNLLGAATLPTCDEFNLSDERFQQECLLSGGCMKVAAGKHVLRGCSPLAQETCNTQSDTSICFCKNELCNSSWSVLPSFGVIFTGCITFLLL